MSHKLIIEIDYGSGTLFESSHPSIEDILSNIQNFDSTLEGMKSPHLLFHFGIKPEGPHL